MDSSEYIRVGGTYFKKIQQLNRYDRIIHVLKKWNRQDIVDDFDKEFLKSIAKYDSFGIFPDNKNYKPNINNIYNLYNEFNHKEEKGDCSITLDFIQHIFGEQYELGLKYMQALYLHPRKILPILVLTSKDRSTGKTTFIDYLKAVFSDNCVLIEPDDLTGRFNSGYATANIICVDESQVEKSTTVEKVKSIATGKTINYKRKHLDDVQMPFYGKLVMATNKEYDFIKIDDEEIRFWIRKIESIPEDKRNTNIDEDLVKEIPAFLYFLSQLPALDFSRSRMLFTPEEIKTDQLYIVKEESKSSLYKKIVIYFRSVFDEHEDFDYIDFTYTDVKKMFFKNELNIGVDYIRKVLRNEFEYKPSETTKSYYKINDLDNKSHRSTGKIIRINRNLAQIDINGGEEISEPHYQEKEGEIPF